MRFAELLARTRRRCVAHRQSPGVCRHCLLWEAEAMLLEEHPELRKEEARKLVCERLVPAERRRGPT